MKSSEILIKINELIVDEKGEKVRMDDLFIDAQLDSLGTMIFFLNLETEFPHLFDGVPDDQHLESLDIPTLKVRDLVTKCKLSTVSSSMEP